MEILIRIHKSVKHDFWAIPDHLSGQDLPKIVKNHVLRVYTRQNVHFWAKKAHFRTFLLLFELFCQKMRHFERKMPILSGKIANFD